MPLTLLTLFRLQVVLNMDTEIGQVQLRKPQVKDGTPKLFTFDGVFYTQDTTEQIYEVYNMT